MTGLELLRDEMIKRGCRRQAVEGETVAVVLDIVSNNGTKYQEMAKEEHDLSKLIKDRRKELVILERRVRDLEIRAKSLRQEIAELNAEALDDNSYIDDFLAKMEACETAEGRDAMRRAQIFINSIDIETAANNTAFIIGLAAILSDGKIGAIDGLKSLNKKVPKSDNRVTRL